MRRAGLLAAVLAACAAGAAPGAAAQIPVPAVADAGQVAIPALPGAAGALAVTDAEIVAALRAGAPRKLRRARPAWFTRSVQRRLARDRDGVMAAPVDAPLPGAVGIRPGAWMISPYWCTMNFLFQKSGVLAIGTAGHCVEPREPVVLLTLAPTGGDPVLVELGKVVLKRDAGIGKDYALVAIPAARREWAFPTMGLVGGPCGVFAGGDPQPVAHYGHGLGVGTGGTPRAGMGFELEEDPGLVRGVDWDWDADSIVWAGMINGGDSGSGVRTAALPAVSNLTHGIGITGLEPSAIAWGTRVTTITSSGWQLVSSPLCA